MAMESTPGKGASVKKTRRLFSELEKHLLATILVKEKSILDVKQNTSKANRAKSQAWDRIAAAFNSQKGIQPADVKTLKKVWDNLKTKAKKDVSQEKKDRRQTGGGTIDPDATADDTSHMVASLCNDVLHPLDNDVDDDAGYHKQDANDFLMERSTSKGNAQVEELEYSPPSVVIHSLTPSLTTPQPKPAASEPKKGGKATSKRRNTSEPMPSSQQSSTSMSAVDRALMMEQTEHELQIKRLRQKMAFEEDEHEERMKLLKMQQDFVQKLQDRMNSPASSGSNESSYSLYQMYSQMN